MIPGYEVSIEISATRFHIKQKDINYIELCMGRYQVPEKV